MSRHDDPAYQPDVRPEKRARDEDQPPTERKMDSYTVQVFPSEATLRKAPTGEKAFAIINRYKRVEALACSLLAMHDACDNEFEDQDPAAEATVETMERTLAAGWRWVNNRHVLNKRMRHPTQGRHEVYDRPYSPSMPKQTSPSANDD